MKKNMFYVFYKSLKNMYFYVFKIFLYVFFVLFNDMFLLFLKTKNVQNYKYDAFIMGKDSISWTERVFCSIIIDFTWFVLTMLLISMDTVV